MEKTTFQEVYDFFLSKIGTHDYDNFTQEELEIEFKQLLLGAFAKSSRILKDIKLDIDYEEFSRELTYAEIDIISNWMVYVFLTPQINNSKVIKQRISSKDYQIYSQANHLKELLELYNNVKNETQTMMTRYTFDNFRAGE